MSMTYLFLAYLSIWIALSFYIWRMSEKQNKLMQEIEDLKKILAEKETREEVNQ